MTWLRYTGVAPPVMPLQQQFGPYVPVSIMHGYTPSDPPLYWRLMDPEFNLVEIGIDRRDGHFVSFTLVFCKDVVRTVSKTDETPPAGEDHGVPLFSLDPWADNSETGRYDVSGKCRLELSSKDARVVLSSDDIHHRVVNEVGLIWEFNAANELQSILLPNLTPHDRTSMEESLRNLGTPGI